MKTETQRLTQSLSAAVAAIVCATNLCAQTVFTDSFDSGASPLWSNLAGNWFATNGVYRAANPDSTPPTFTGLPFVLQNFAIDVDINKVADGGIWLRCDATTSNGVLLVTGGNGWGSGSRAPNAGRSLYWHVMTPYNWSHLPIPKLNEAFNVFPSPGVGNVHLRVEVVGNRYSAFLNGSTNAITSLTETNGTYSSGLVALYDFSEQTFDNFVLQIPLGFGPYSINIAQPDVSHIALSWPTNAIGWDLESTPYLVPPNWSTVTNAPVIIGTNFSSTISLVDSQRFFRLHRQ